MAQNPKCYPLQYNVNSPVGPPLPGVPGFSVDINFPTAPLPSLKGIPEDIISWLNRLKLKLPGGGELKEAIEKLSRTISSILAKLLGYLNLFMGYLMFAMAIIKLILCIIKTLCAFPNPWSVIRATKRLLRECVPLFISICFPYFAWLILLLSLIELLLALIEYIIMMIIRLIKQIIKNMLRLYNLTFKQRSPNAALAIIAKIANLMCLFQMIFEFLAVVFGIIEIITKQWSEILKVCSRGSPGPNGERGPEDDDVCAEFMKDPIAQTNQNIEIYKSRVGSSDGYVWYCNTVYGNQTLPLPTPPAVVVVRNEAVYLYDNSLIDTLKFNNIISSGGFTFFPFDKVITKDIQDRLKPYFVDLFITCDPGDGHGSRKIQVDDVTVTYVTTSAVQTVTSSVPGVVANSNGYLILSGGTTVNDAHFNGRTIETLLGKKESASPNPGEPVFNNGSYLSFQDVEYSLKINYDALGTYNLITMGCFPSVQVEQGVLNTSFSKIFNFALPDFVTLPDVGGAIETLTECFNNYTKNMTIDTTNTFGDCMLAAVNKLNDEASNTFCQLLLAAIDIYGTTITLDTDLQFVNNNILVTITPTDQAGRTILDLIGSFVPPPSCMNNLADKFTGNVTLGEIDKFSYDGYGNFISNITSKEAGDGYLNVYFDGDMIKQVIKPSDPSIQPSIIDYTLTYTFVGAVSDGYIPAVRRDETDNGNNR